MKRFKFLLSILAMTLMLDLVPFNSFTANAFPLVPTDATCQTIDSYIEMSLQALYDAQEHGDATKAQYFVHEYKERKQWKEANCKAVCEYPKVLKVTPLGHNVDGSPYRVSRFNVVQTGDIAFCISPDTKYNTGCTNYVKQGSPLDTWQAEQIARIVYGFHQVGSDDWHYVGSQLAIWEILGYPRTIDGGQTKWDYGYADIEAAMYGGSKSISVNMDSGFVLDLGDNYSSVDHNGKLNEYFHVGAVTDGVTAEKNGNQIDGVLNSIYPLTKTVKVDADRATVGGDIHGGSKYVDLALSSQQVFSFNGSVEDTSFFNGGEFNVVTATGSLELSKRDEWGDNARAGHKFKIWYAKADENGTAVDDEGNKWSKFMPFQTEIDWKNNVEQSVFTTDDSGKLTVNSLPSGGKFDEETPIGTYIIQEVETTYPYVLNNKEYVFHVERDSKTSLTVLNENVDVKLNVEKKDAEEPGNIETEEILLNGATFEIYDVSHLDGLSMDTNDGKNPLLNNYFLKVGKSVDLSILFANDSVVSGITGEIGFEIINPHCNTATLEGKTLTANKTDTLQISVLEDGNRKTMLNLYLIADNDDLGTEDSFVIQGIGVWRGTTGKANYQMVDTGKHNLPLANTDVTIYCDEELSVPFKTITTDYFGMIDYSEGNLVEGSVDDGDNLYYFKGNEDKVVEVSGDLLKENPAILKGLQEIPNLKHSRKYLVCEAKKPMNYDIVDGENPCYYMDSDYPEGTLESLSVIKNRKGRGDLEIQKLNEWLEPDGEGVQFKLYHAELEDTGLSYEENWKNVKYDEYGMPVKGKLVMNPVTGNDYFEVDKDGKIYIPDYLYFGSYILQEVETVNSFNKNKELILLTIKHAETSKIEFVNENRTISFEVFKMDAEENYRKLNDAEFTVYDISNTLDTDMKPTDLGLKGDLESKEEEIDADMMISPYNIESLHFAKLNQPIDLYNWLIAGTDDEKLIDHRPIKYNLSYTNLGTVNVDGVYTPMKTGYVEVEIVGGTYSLYGTAGPSKVYNGTAFNPYEDLYFYEDEAMTRPVNIENIVYTGEFDTSVNGEYILHYVLTAKDHTVYEFDRSIEVIDDTRHICMYDKATDSYIYNDTHETCDEIDSGMNNYHKDPEVVALILSDADATDEWNGTFVNRYRIYNVTDDDKINATESKFDLNSLLVFKGKTGHAYVQMVDRNNHNLPLGNKEFIAYYDKDLKYPYRSYTSDEFGMVDLNGKFTEIGPKPMITKDEDGTFYIPKAIPTETKTCEYLGEGFALNEETGKCMNDEGKIAEPRIVTEWAVEKTVVPDYDPEFDSAMAVETEITEVYYQDGEKKFEDGTTEPIVKKASLTALDGHIEMPNLKHSRKYLVCETELPEGYDFSENQNACFVVDGDYAEDISHDEAEMTNILRRVDVILYKTNDSRNIRLNNAEFDVWETFEEGKDMNEVNGTINGLGVATTTQGTKYLEDAALGSTDEFGACEYKDEEGNLIDAVGVDSAYNETSKELPTGTCYKKYVPSTVGKKYLGHYITGGIYTKVDVPNASIEIATDSEFKNIFKTIQPNAEGEVRVYSLPSGKYYLRLKRPLKDTFVFEEKLEDGTTIIHVPTADDYVPFDELDPIYKEVMVQEVDTGMIKLPEIKYGHNLLFTETKAPAGYHIDQATFEIIPKAEYGIKRMENYRENSINIPSNTSAY